MRRFVVLVSLVCVVAVFMANFNSTLAQAEQKRQTFNVCWSHYVTWELMGYAKAKGIFKKWADKYGIEVKVTEPMKYGETLSQFAAGAFDACVMTNMDALISPASGGVDTEVIVVQDSSHGNDGAVIKGASGLTVADLKGRKLYGVQFSVSHYMISRMLQMNGMSERDITFVNVDDEMTIPSLFAGGKDGTAVVTWNPFLMNVRTERGAQLIFDSSKIPGEILDMFVVRTAAPESLKKALAGAWYEVLPLMHGMDQASKDAVALMAAQSESTVEQFRAQLKTTNMFYESGKAREFVESPGLKTTMDLVRTFSFDHGLLGQGAKSKDVVGVQFPDGSVLGDPKNVKFRFTSKYMRMAAEGAL